MFAKFVLAGIALLYVVMECSGTPAETALLNSLMESYDPRTRGASNINDSTTLHYGASLIRVPDFDFDNDIVTVSLYEKMLWQDVRLEWDPTKFGGLTALRIPSHLLWKPDLKLFYSMSLETTRDLDTNVIVYSSGDVLWVPKAVYKVPCSLQHGHNWKCPMKFGSWTYDGFQLKLALYEDKTQLDLTAYIERRGVQITGSKAKLVTKYYPCCSEPYPLIEFNLKLRTTHGP